MADGANPAASAPSPGTTAASSVSSADVANANALNQAVSAIRQQLSADNTAVITAINAITSAINASMIGGSTGAAANHVLISKGTAGIALQPSVVIIDNSGNVTGVAQLSTSGNVGIGQAAGPERLDLTTATQQTTDGAVFTAPDTHFLRFLPSAGASNYNPITQAGDEAVIYAFGSIGTGGLVIAPWNATGSGFRMDANGILRLSSEGGFPQASLTDAATISWNLQTQQSAYVLLTAGVGATRALSNPTNMIAGFTYILEVQQSSTGSNALTYGTAYKWPNGVAPILSTANNAIDIVTFVSDGTHMFGVLQKNFS